MLKQLEAVRWFLITSVLLLLTVSCTGRTVMASGIEGSVTIGPTCPESQDNKPCEQYEPYEVKIVIREARSQSEVASTKSDAAGKFRVELPPGEYIVEPATRSQFVPPYAESQLVVVHEGAFTAIEIVYDSGIR